MVTIGIDWGTHSSKWSRSNSAGKSSVGKLYSSTLAFNPVKKEVMFPKGEAEPRQTHPGLSYAERLKRKIIEDPLAPFWEGCRSDSGMSLGASVTFSLCSLLRAAWDNMPVAERREIGEVAFSFPNWSLNEHEQNVQALHNFRSAALTAVKMFFANPEETPRLGEFTSKSSLEELISRYRMEPPDRFPVERVEAMDLSDKVGDITTTYIMESIAAGLPYLARLNSQGNQVRRLLVVDAGAGSTDIGYLCTWRTKPHEDFYFLFFPPAPTCGLAGEVITSQLARKERISPQQAELEKIALAHSGRLLTKLPYISQEWIPNLSSRVSDYLITLERHALMRMPVPVNVILTGGSGAIPGLSGAVVSQAEEGLASNRNEPGARPPAAVRPVQEQIQLGLGLDEFETGRMAVSLGACWPEKKRLLFWRKMGDVA